MSVFPRELSNLCSYARKKNDRRWSPGAVTCVQGWPRTEVEQFWHVSPLTYGCSVWTVSVSIVDQQMIVIWSLPNIPYRETCMGAEAPPLVYAHTVIMWELIGAAPMYSMSHDAASFSPLRWTLAVLKDRMDCFHWHTCSIEVVKDCLKTF